MSPPALIALTDQAIAQPYWAVARVQPIASSSRSISLSTLVIRSTARGYVSGVCVEVAGPMSLDHCFRRIVLS